MFLLGRGVAQQAPLPTQLLGEVGVGVCAQIQGMLVDGCGKNVARHHGSDHGVEDVCLGYDADWLLAEIVGYGGVGGEVVDLFGVQGAEAGGVGSGPGFD